MKVNLYNIMTKISSEQKSGYFHIETLGCRVNQYESDALTAELITRGWKPVEDGQTPQLQILNTCTVTAEAARKVRQNLRRMRSHAPEAFLVAWGCHAEFDGIDLDCDLRLGNRAKGEVTDFILERLDQFDATDISSLETYNETEQEFMGVDSEEQFSEFSESPLPQDSRAYVKVQDGCDNHCTYCAIRLVRGSSRSRTLQSVVKEVEQLCKAGYREIQLSGIHLSAYGQDLEPRVDLGDLVLALDEVAGLERLRLGSLEPEVIREDVITKFTQAKHLAPHLHLALQSGSATVLKRMGRNYTKDEYAAAVSLLKDRWSGLELTTDLMVGFPGEIEEEHQESMSFVEAVGFSDLHIFRFSPRPGTAATRLPNPVPNSIKRERAHEAEELRLRLHRLAQERQIGRQDSIMLEGMEPAHGYTGTYLRCELEDEDRLNSSDIGQFIPIRVTKLDDDGLKAVTLW